ncbi:hypothetical protein ACFCZ1_03890 [Streptomyces sp. NPDC056224]|uniref:hypothetical protein n=1 Tax=Streptomyces sp. NPDC056224 TaxID=3345750 RepID=UPI0035DD6A9C
MPHAPRSAELTDETSAELEMSEFPMSLRPRTDSRAGPTSAGAGPVTGTVADA